MRAETPMPMSRWLRGCLLLFVGLGGFSACLTLLFLGMRSVMDVGGACADGGPYVSAQPCPQGVAWIMPGSIWAGLAFLAIYAFHTMGGPNLALLAWPALFLSLGWNFLEYGLDPPFEGLGWGWLVCAAIFFVMGAAPLFFLFSKGAFRTVFWGNGLPAARPSRPSREQLRVPFRPAERRMPDAPSAQAAPPDDEPGDDLVDALERLAALREKGALDDAEYEAAKDAVIRDRSAT